MTGHTAPLGILLAGHRAGGIILPCGAMSTSDKLIKTGVRTLFTMTSRAAAERKARRVAGRYLSLADGLSPEEGRRAVRVPPMRGVDEDMREWSFYMILEHNSIVNRSISATVGQLVRGEPLSGPAALDMKKDVMPSATAGEEQVQDFRESVDEHLAMMAELGPLRGTETAPHSLFGPFDAHRWHCMFALHLKIHFPQAERVVQAVRTGGEVLS